MSDKMEKYEGEIRRGWIWAAMFLVLALTAIFFFESVAYGFGSRLLPIYSVETAERKIAVTFNCAWDAADIPDILAALEKYDAKATFFLVGSWAEQNPDAVEMIAKAGHEIGTHSNTHPDMAAISKEKIIEELSRSCERIAAAGGGTPKLFRAPSGSYNNTLIKTAAEEGFTTIQWDVDSRDWKNPDPSEMVTKVTENVRCGSIILFHSGAKPTAKALLQILDILSQQGYSFITVSELIYKDNYTINNEGRQIKLADAA